MAEMGTFRIEVEVENPARPGERRRVQNVLIDTGADLSWFPADVLIDAGPVPAAPWALASARQRPRTACCE